MGVNESSSSFAETTSQSSTTNFVPNCALLLSSPKFMPFFRASSKKPNFVAPNIIVIGEVVQRAAVTAADKCFTLLHLFASQNPLLKEVLSLPNKFHSFCHQVRCTNYRNVKTLQNHNFAAVLPGDSMAGLVVANGISNFLNLYNTLLVVRLVLTWFPNSPAAIVSPLSTICDPYLNIFRGLIPPLGGTLDLSPILAFLVLNAFTSTASALPAELPVTEANQENPSSSARFSHLSASQKKWVRRLQGNRTKSSKGEQNETKKERGHFSVSQGLGLLAVISPLYIDRREEDDSEEDEAFNFDSWLPLLLIVLILAITASLFLERRLARFDPYWIHRVGGSSGGILVILMILALVLKCKSASA
ncbi:hypothetical protein FNV43_RR11290 [Rhamnella rubrinervis]|uniref:Uncharacterized protein n=1 Tax=Rhamnella rubrinervis TaxID=2594499 RepID=A0A8K0H5I7_9ROSA|nr:hypothetical protein FNV43_RR11290 [Rhamnella rubrinervis]